MSVYEVEDAPGTWRSELCTSLLLGLLGGLFVAASGLGVGLSLELPTPAAVFGGIAFAVTVVAGWYALFTASREGRTRLQLIVPMLRLVGLVAVVDGLLYVAVGLLR